MDIKELKNRFSYHTPKEGQPEKYMKLRAKAFEYAKLIDELCPDSREKSIALDNLDAVSMFSNAAIARRE